MFFITPRTVISALRSRRALALESLALRHQLDVVKSEKANFFTNIFRDQLNQADGRFLSGWSFWKGQGALQGTNLIENG